MVDADRLLSVVAPSEIGATGAQLHHIATIYEGEAGWASKFADLFDCPGYSLEDDINQVAVDGHFGPHPDAYHQMIFDELTRATAGLDGDAMTAAFEQSMQILRQRVTDPNDILNALITR